MYDLIVSLGETLFKNGLTLSSLGAVVFLLLKQRKTKKRLMKVLPFLFHEESEVKEYQLNQEIIKHNLQIMMKGMGLQWVVPTSSKSSANTVTKQRGLFSFFSGITTFAHVAEQLPKRRYQKMDEIKVIIDPGHGEEDSGAAAGGKTEKDFVLSVSLKVQQKLKNHKHIKIQLTRTKDVFLELQERVNIAQKAKADAFVSIHANSAVNGSATGTETFYTRPNSLSLATIVHKHLIAATKLRDRGVKNGNFHVIRETTMPAILLEVGFISNSNDRAALFDPVFQDNVAERVAMGLCEYFKVPYKEEAAEEVKKKVTKIAVTINNQKVEEQGVLIDGVSYIPTRAVTHMNGRFFWDQKEKNIIIYTKKESE
ncbi:N-acetylmuramoyl-L-alanine amidase [Paenibacillus urinalis]|uniref:N-acetylmuramoyl-L-alanine amidase n=1 Tax=Paenibacillus urinalis TaxID=521520 RepID=UPI001961FC8E